MSRQLLSQMQATKKIQCFIALHMVGDNISSATKTSYTSFSLLRQTSVDGRQLLAGP